MEVLVEEQLDLELADLVDLEEVVLKVILTLLVMEVEELVY